MILTVITYFKKFWGYALNDNQSVLAAANSAFSDYWVWHLYTTGGFDSRRFGGSGMSGTPSNIKLNPPRSGSLIGDVNGDGVISVQDAILVQRYIVGLESLTYAQRMRADVNYDGVINITKNFKFKEMRFVKIKSITMFTLLVTLVGLLYFVPTSFSEGELEVDIIKKEIAEIMDKNLNELEFVRKINNDYLFKSKSEELIFYDSKYNYVSKVYIDEPILAENSMISENCAKSNAYDFISNYYPKKEIFNDNNMTFEVTDHGTFKQYMFMWWEEINGIKGPNCVFMIVNPYNGNIMNYASRYMKSVAPTTPRFNKEEAINLAKQMFDNEKIIDIDAELGIWVNPETVQEYLVWDISLLIKNENDHDDAVSLVGFYIDAIKGEILF